MGDGTLPCLEGAGGPRCNVTVSVVTFNRLAYTEQCLTSIIGRTKMPHRLEVFDNGSHDGTVPFLKSLFDQGLIDRLWLSPTNVGMSKAKNLLVQEAKTEWVCVSDNDVLVYDDWLESMFRILNARKDIMAVTPYRHPAQEIGRGVVAGIPIRFLPKLGGIFVIRRDHYLSVPGMDERLLIGFVSTPFMNRLHKKYPKALFAALDVQLADHLGDAVPDVQFPEYNYWTDLPKSHGIPAPDYRVWQQSGVDIVIPVYGALNETAVCVEAIEASTRHPHQVWLVNDRFEDEPVVARLAKKWGAEYLGHRDQMGFAKSCNDGWHFGSHPYVCFLNTDTIPAPRWLDRLVACIAADPAVGIVGPSTSKCAGEQTLVQYHEKRATYTYRDVRRIGDEVADRFRAACRKTNICGFCFLTRRSLLEQLNGFDEKYGLGYGEENDFELRSWKLGFKSLWVQGAYVNHLGAKSFKGVDPALLKEVRARNTRLFEQRKRDLSVAWPAQR